MTPDTKRKVLLIGWDAADWEHINPLIEQGLMPTLDKVINNGVMGNLATLHPVLSPMLWNSVATGKYAHKHGVHGFIEPDPVNGGARPSSSHSRKVKALWNIFTQVGLRSNVIGWWASHPAEAINGCVVTNAFNGAKFKPETKQYEVSTGTIHPADRARFLAQFKVFTNELTHEHVFPFIPNADRIDQEKDPRLDSFAKVLSECATIQSVATAVMETEPWDFMAIYFSAIDHFCHAFMQYHPPRMPNTREDDFEIYKDVINGAYRFHDMMLARQLELAGPDTTVIICSDHGFQSGNLRPYATPREPAGPAVWHRDMGMIVMAGPGIRKDERIYGASLIDVAPTILALYDLPVGDDMDGRPLVEAFEAEQEIKTIPSWEEVPGDCGMHASEEQMSKEDADDLMQQFAALGYIDDPDADKEKQYVDADVEQKYNLARNYLWTKQVDEALPLFEEIARKRPWETRFLTQLSDCYYQAGYLRQAEKLLTASFADISKVPNPSVLLTWAKLKLELGEREGAIVGLTAAEKINMRLPGILIQVGDIYLKMRRYGDAQRVYERAIELHEESPMAHQGLSSIYLRKREMARAADHALRAVGLIHRLPLAHFNLGVAMARSGDYERAAIALQTALLFAPRMQNAHRWLAALYRAELDDVKKADYHQEEARKVSEEVKSHGVDRGDRRHTLFELPDIPNEEDRQRILLEERPDPQNPKAKSGKTFVLVSGLPRSGTSMMMQMLDAGGIEPLTDEQKKADEDNPKGYYEWEPLKQIRKRPALLDEDGMDQKAVKCVTALLQQMPARHDYKVIFMTRPIEEVVASQDRMVENQGAEGAALDAPDLARGLAAHRDDMIKWMAKRANMQSLVIDYPSLIANPEATVPLITEFLGTDRITRPENMASVVDPSLYRQRVDPARTPARFLDDPLLRVPV